MAGISRHSTHHRRSDTRAHMQALLESQELYASTENTVFVAVSVWLAAHGNDAAAAARLAPLMRFPLLTSAFLIDVVPQARAQHFAGQLIDAEPLMRHSKMLTAGCGASKEKSDLRHLDAATS